MWSLVIPKYRTLWEKKLIITYFDQFCDLLISGSGWGRAGKDIFLKVVSVRLFSYNHFSKMFLSKKVVRYQQVYIYIYFHKGETLHNIFLSYALNYVCLLQSHLMSRWGRKDWFHENLSQIGFSNFRNKAKRKDRPLNSQIYKEFRKLKYLTQTVPMYKPCNLKHIQLSNELLHKRFILIKILKTELFNYSDFN